VRPTILLLTSSVAGLAVWASCKAVDGSPEGAPSVSDIDGAVGAGTACVACVTDQDCPGSRCMQLGSDSYCALPCPTGNECSSDLSCTAASSVSGDLLNVCVPRGDICSQPSGDRSKTPQPDGGSTTPTGPLDAGGPVTGTVTGDGGSLSRLFFAVAGDTRPANVDDTSGYPSAIIGKIYSDIQALNPRPAFVVSSGDYMFASTSGTQAAPQLDLYMKARDQFSGPVFPAMGNHECTGYTDSNCGTGAKDGVTKNYTAFVTQMLGPISKSEPYYAINIDAIDKSWTAKFVFVAANAWSTAQSSWLTTTLSQNTTYTFIVRHESHDANTAPGVTPSEQIMAKHPYTLAIVGHTHTYEHFTTREVIMGNGGAPLTGSKNYGFGLFSQRADGAIAVDMVDYSTGATDTGFRFAVKPDGTLAP
jgi:hypothetical protein